MNELKINFYPVVMVKGKKPEDDKEIPYMANVKVFGFKDELFCFFQWLISYIISHCARKLGKPIYRIELDNNLNEDIFQIIRDHYNDIIECDINQVSLEFGISSQDKDAKVILEDLNNKLQRNPYVRNALKRRFYDLKSGCKAYLKAKAFNRQDDVSTITEIFKDPNRWYEFRRWESTYDQVVGLISDHFRPYSVVLP